MGHYVFMHFAPSFLPSRAGAVTRIYRSKRDRDVRERTTIEQVHQSQHTHGMAIGDAIVREIRKHLAEKAGTRQGARTVHSCRVN